MYWIIDISLYFSKKRSLKTFCSSIWVERKQNTNLPGETNGKSNMITTAISMYIKEATKVHWRAMSEIKNKNMHLLYE